MMTPARMLRLLPLLAAALSATPTPPVSESLAGEPVDVFADAQRGVLLLFVAPDCPISNRYAPTLGRIAATAAADGIATWLVYADDLAKPERIREHRSEYALAIPAVMDRQFALAAYAGAEVTPEAVLFALPDNGDAPQLVYRGRIDDQYEGFGVFRPAATTSELTTTLTALAAGTVPDLVTTKAIGCYIPRPHP